MAPDSASLPPVEKVSGLVSVETPEQIQFTFRLAGPGARMLAYLIDLAIRAGIVSVVSFTLMAIIGVFSEELSGGLLLVLLFAVEWGYYTLIEWRWNGSTPGKKALGIRVVRTDGVALDFVRSAMRNLLRAADIFPLFYASGLAVMFLSGTQRRLGDIAADTMVIREAPARLKDLPPLPEDATPLPAGALKELRLRDFDLGLIDEFFRRRHLFSPDRARELASILAEPAVARLALEEEDPEKLIAGMLLASHEVRSSWYGRTTAASIPGAPIGGRR
jgi:uncharacterized RDD family membrane protein YckC